MATGGAGFLGQHVVSALGARGAQNVFVPRSRDYDLVKESQVEKLFRDHPADLVIHLAARVGGIGANQKNPGKFLYDNLMMGALVMEYARRSKVQKFVQVGTICSYPKFSPIPFREENLWNGYPEETNAPYGLAKKILLVQAQAYRQQYNFNAICLLLVNLYGEGDSDDLESSHVIPALIRKCLEAQALQAKEIVLWGTGQPTREFLYVRDAAEGILDAAEKYDKPEPVNLGSGLEISIRDLIALIAKETGFRGQIRWDAARPDGQPRRLVDSSRAREAFGFSARTPLEEGLRRTIEGYRKRSPANRGVPRENQAAPR